MTGSDGDAQGLHPNLLTNEGMEEFLHSIIKPESIAFCLFVMYLTMWSFEVGLHWLRHKLAQHKHLLMLMNRSTEELMIMGLTSLIIFVLQLTAEDSHLLEKLTFELLHMTLFLAMILFLVFTAIVLGGCRVFTSPKWHKFEAGILRQQLIPSGEAESFSRLRNDFIEWNKLSHSFLFHSYLKDCLFYLIKEVIEFDAKMWLGAYVFILPLTVDHEYMYLFYGLVFLGYLLLIVKTYQIRKHLYSVGGSVDLESDLTEDQQGWFYFQDQPASAFSIIWELRHGNPVPEAKVLFWFGCPRFFRFVLHLLLLFTAITVSVTAVFFRGTFPPYVIVILFIAAFAGVTAVALYILPTLALTMGVGRLINEPLVAKCVKGVKLDVLQQPMRPRGFTEAILRAQLPKSIEQVQQARRRSQESGQWQRRLSSLPPLRTSMTRNGGGGGEEYGFQPATRTSLTNPSISGGSAARSGPLLKVIEHEDDLIAKKNHRRSGQHVAIKEIPEVIEEDSDLDIEVKKNTLQNGNGFSNGIQLKNMSSNGANDHKTDKKLQHTQLLKEDELEDESDSVSVSGVGIMVEPRLGSRGSASPSPSPPPPPPYIEIVAPAVIARPSTTEEHQWGFS